LPFENTFAFASVNFIIKSSFLKMVVAYP